MNKDNEKKSSNQGNRLDAYPKYLKVTDEGILLTCFIKPSSKKEEIIINPDELMIQITEPPSKGKANKAIIEILSDFFHIPHQTIQIVSGEKSSTKIIRIASDEKSTAAIIKIISASH